MIKKYKLDAFDSLVAADDGYLVYYDDYQALKAERDALKELNGEFVELLEACTAGETVYTKGFGRIIKAALNKAREVSSE